MFDKIKQYKRERMENLDWSSKRRLIYIVILTVVFFSYIFYILYPTLYPAPTCKDRLMNGIEIDIDCGGACELQCKNTYNQLEVVLQKSFVSVASTTDIVVVLENKNKYMAPKNIKVDVDLYTKGGSFVETVSKEALAGTQKYIPVYIDNYKSADIGKVIVRSMSYDMYTTNGAYDVALVDYNMSEDKMRLNIKIKNIYKQELNEKLKLYVLIRDELDNVVAINHQDINAMKFEEVKSLNFLWPEAIKENIKSIDIFVISNLYK